MVIAVAMTEKFGAYDEISRVLAVDAAFIKRGDCDFRFGSLRYCMKRTNTYAP